MITKISWKMSNYIVASITLIALTYAVPGAAGDAPDEGAPYAEHADYFIERIQSLDMEIKDLRAKAKGASGNIARIINRRLERKEVEALEMAGKLARMTLEEENRGGDVSKYRPRIADKLEKLPDALLKTIEQLRGSLRELVDASADVTGKDRLALVKSRSQLGQRLETVPQSDPVELADRAGALELQVLFEREPLAGVTVTATSAANPGEVRTARTDEIGMARLSLERSGGWWVTTRHREGDRAPLDATLFLAVGEER